MKRKLGIICDCIAGADPVDTLDLIKETGFDSFFSDTYSVETTQRLKAKADALGLTYEFIHAPFSGINNMWLEGDAYLDVYNGMINAIDAAAACNVPIVILHVSSGWDTPQINDLGLARYDAIVDYAEKNGVIAAFENLRKTGNVAYFVDRYENRDCVRFCYDNGHEHCYTKTVCWMDIFTHYVVATHIHDNPGRGWEKVGDNDFHMLPFDGTCDFEMMMRKLNEYGYEGCLMLELGNSRYQDMTAKEFLQTAYDRIKKISEM